MSSELLYLHVGRTANFQGGKKRCGLYAGKYSILKAEQKKAFLRYVLFLEMFSVEHLIVV